MRSILIVDDEPNIVETARFILEFEGYHVLTAGNGGRALEVMREHRPAVVLLDVTMPGMDGYAVCSAIREDPALASTFVIFLTARSQRSDEERALQAGANAFLRKPFDDDEVRLLIERAFVRDGEPR